MKKYLIVALLLAILILPALVTAQEFPVSLFQRLGVMIGQFMRVADYQTAQVKSVGSLKTIQPYEPPVTVTSPTNPKDPSSQPPPPPGVTTISSWKSLHELVRRNLAGDYVLFAHLSSASPDYGLYASCDNGNAGWEPIGTTANPFTGTFHGNGYTISDLCIDRPNIAYQGLFSALGPGANIMDVGLVNANVTGGISTGMLAGLTGSGASITNSYAEGEMNGRNQSGGLVGQNGYNSTILDSYTTNVFVHGADHLGGLVGNNRGTISGSYSTAGVNTDTGSFVGGLVGVNDLGTISDSYSTGIVNNNYSYGGNNGGLVGMNYLGTISDSYSTANVITIAGGDGGLVGSNLGTISNSHATGNVVSRSIGLGGLVGRNTGTILASYATGSVLGEEWGSREVGGLVGSNGADGQFGGTAGIISNSFSTGGVRGRSEIGGLIGVNRGDASSISSSYSTGNVIGHSLNVGGLVGYSRNSIPAAVDSVWNTNTSGQATSFGGTPATIDQMTTNSIIYINWDRNVWEIPGDTTDHFGNTGYPTLR